VPAAPPIPDWRRSCVPAGPTGGSVRPGPRLRDAVPGGSGARVAALAPAQAVARVQAPALVPVRSEEHTSELQSRENLVCRLLLEKKKMRKRKRPTTTETPFTASDCRIASSVATDKPIQIATSGLLRARARRSTRL